MRNNTQINNKAIILLSGGLDSATNLAIMKNLNLDIYALSFSYGQKHSIELECAKNLAKEYNVKEHKIINLPELGQMGGSALTDKNINVPKKKTKGAIPPTYVPARNTIFLSYALAYGEVKEIYNIFVGSCADDTNPDTTDRFFKKFQKMANAGTSTSKYKDLKFRIRRPLIHLTKKMVIAKGLSLGADYSKTFTCYDPSDMGISCGECAACRVRLVGFNANYTADPIKYQDLK